MLAHHEETRKLLRDNRDLKWGFIVYRCTYGDDEAWDHLMYRLKWNARNSLKAEGSEDLFDQVDWNVQEDPSLDGAGVTEVKKRFREWVATNYPDGCQHARMDGCLMIDKQSIKSVTSKEAPPADDYDLFGQT